MAETAPNIESSSIRILVGETSLTSTGTDMRYKLISDNGKGLKLHGVGLTWNG
jgi:hypothetical protein